MKLYTVAWLLLCFGSLNQGLAQQTTHLLSTQGGTYSGTTIQLDWAVGEPFVSTHITASGILTEGVLQPRLIVFPLREQLEQDLQISLSPNPTKAELYIEFEMLPSSGIQLSVFDAYGKLVGMQQLAQTDGRQSYDMTRLLPGTYLFHFYDEERRIFQTRRIVKIQ